MTRAAFSKKPQATGWIIKILIILIILFLLVRWLHCDILASELQFNKERQFEYANYLYKNGEYYRAITEYKRLIFFTPQGELSEIATLQIGRSYLAGGQIDDAIAFWEQQLEKQELPVDKLEQIKILLGISLLDHNQTDIFSFRETNINKAMEVLRALEPSSLNSRLVGRFTAEWQNRDMDKKSPWIAGTLSAVIPGAGSYYTGRYLEGAYAFFLTTLFYLAARDASDNDQNELGAVFGLLTVGFYGGSIYTAINGTHKLNDKWESDELLRIRQKHGIWFIPETDKYPGRF